MVKLIKERNYAEFEDFISFKFTLPTEITSTGMSGVAHCTFLWERTPVEDKDSIMDEDGGTKDIPQEISFSKYDLPQIELIKRALSKDTQSELSGLSDSELLSLWLRGAVVEKGYSSKPHNVLDIFEDLFEEESYKCKTNNDYSELGDSLTSLVSLEDIFLYYLIENLYTSSSLTILSQLNTGLENPVVKLTFTAEYSYTKTFTDYIGPEP